MRFNKRVSLADLKRKISTKIPSCGRSIPTPENTNTGGCSYNIPNLCTRLEIHPEVLAIIEDGDEGSDNHDQFHCDPNDDFSDPNLDDISKDIDEEGPVEGENANPHSGGNTGLGIVIRNNSGSFMTDVDPDVTLALPPPAFEMVPDCSLRRHPKGRPQSTRIRNDMDVRETDEPKRCTVCRTSEYNRSTCPHHVYVSGQSSRNARLDDDE
ncbi:hypothetical protein GOBAR_AA10539 [Gossypium barbadense]|uniref:Uncharacterized protein n=1 Tax=Gossypium barbadense TaxID=3634 RepID=A0A2P5Y3D5_GOSBA|nr:hypothetical protein GOBAR_AA10539 [Gossypium barbadense]